MSLYYDQINRSALKAWNEKGLGDITIYNFEQWKIHWLATATQWMERLECEGLSITANHVREIVKLNQ